MKRIRCIVIGKMKARHFKDAVDFYAARIGRYYPLDITELKDAPGSLDTAGRARQEGQAILARLGPQDRPVCLDERGKAMTSRRFAEILSKWIDDPGCQPCFIIGGAYGLSDEVRGRCAESLGFGPMTLSHELARVVLMEQIYRAAAILHGHPYHHD